jgi:hypothetical protein
VVAVGVHRALDLEEGLDVRADVRLPLVGISAGSLEKLKAVLATYKLI